MKALKAFLAAAATIGVCGTSAHAADLPAKAPYFKAPPVAVYHWTGFYAGVNAGLGVSQTSASTPGGADGAVDRSGTGFAGGVQAGFNWQFAPQWVAGIEGDIGYLGINRSLVDWDESVAFGVKTNGFGTIRGRLGYASGPSLFYATGGAAFVNIKNNFDRFGPPDTLASKSETAPGWSAGGGIETMLGGNWSTKAEYLYIDAGSQDVFNPFLIQTAHFDNRFHVYRYGVNYRFGGPAPSAILPAYNWNGFYLGVNVGAGLSQNITKTAFFAPPTGRTVDIAGSGFTGGVQAGYNWQFSPNWVAGIEGDIGYLGINHSFANWNDANFVFGVKTDWYGTLRGRVGYSTGPALLYVTGGAAFVHVNDKFDDTDGPTSFVRPATKSGWTVGGGIEAALARNWTAKTEYLYIDASTQNETNSVFRHQFDNRLHVFRFGLNYQFGR